MNDTEPINIELFYNGKSNRIHLGPVSAGSDWQVNCPTLVALLWSEAENTNLHIYTTAPFRLAIAADYIEDYPDSVSFYRHWGEGLPETVSFLTSCLRRAAL